MKDIRAGIVFFAAFILLSLLHGCEKEGLGNAGYIMLNISKDESVEVITTRAESEPVFSIEVVNADGVTVASYDDHRELAENPLRLQPGIYTVKGSTGEKGGDAVFGKPVYAGEDQVTVEAGKVSSANIVCTLSQVMVTVESSEEVDAAFKEIVVTVTNRDNFNTASNLIFSSADNTIDSEGYFACTGLLNYKVYLVNQDGEVSDGDIAGTLDNVKVRDHYILRLSISGSSDGSAVFPGVDVDESTNDKNYDIVINLNKKAKPSFGLTGFASEGVTRVAKGTVAEYKMNITVKGGLESLLLKHKDNTLSELGIPEQVELVGYTDQNIANAGITWSGIAEGATDGMAIDFTSLFSKLDVGSYAFEIDILDKQYQLVKREFAIEIIPDVETTALEVDAWGKHAFLYGIYNTAQQPSGMGFEYKKSSEQSWTKITDVTLDGKNYSAKITGLEPRTEYVFRTVSDKEPSNEISFTTLGADQIENMSFDNWYKDGKQWYANSDLSEEHYWWDSGNKGANTLSEVNPTSPTDVVAVEGDGKQAAKLESKYVVIAFAAGSVYLGEFGSVSGLGASLNFGRPYDCKPLSLKGYYSYAPKAIDKVKAPYEDLKGQMDICNIYVVLADWPSGTFQVNTNTGTFIDFENDPNIIAYGSLEDNTNTNGYKPFEIELEYRNNRQPTCCVIVCTASKYGDYFTGGVGSTLLVDEFEFTF